jgi:hypothetical protein
VQLEPRSAGRVFGRLHQFDITGGGAYVENKFSIEMDPSERRRINVV